MSIGARACFQLGVAATVTLFHRVGPEGMVWLRQAWAGLLLLIVVRPRPSNFTWSSLLACVALGCVTVCDAMFYVAAAARLPLGTASALAYLGPMSVAVARSRGGTKLWPLLAGAGVLLLTQPWRGGADLDGVAFALAVAACWVAYILLIQRVGDEVTGVQGLAVSIPIAGLVATIVVGPSVVSHLSWQVLLTGLGLAVLSPLIPYILDMSALRRLSTVAFGTLMSLTPAIALLIGLVALHQFPGWGPVAGIALVVAAGIGVERAAARIAPNVPVLDR
jgi:inner membrane transporter RhtA